MSERTPVADAFGDADFMQDPHAVYRRLRAQGPVHRTTLPKGVPLFGGLPVWVVSTYSAVRAALTDPRLSTDLKHTSALFARHGTDTAGGAFGAALARHMLHSDPPDHTRLRKLVNKAFTPGAVDRLRPRIEDITSGLLDAMKGREQVDLLAEFAFPLPVTVICELLGVPEADRADFTRWSQRLVSGPSAEEVAAAQASMVGYLTELTAAKRAEPQDDILSALVQAGDEGDRLADSELVPMAFLLLVGGHETTTNLIGNGTLHLLRDRAKLRALRDDPALLPGAVEEFLRFEGPIKHATFRYTTDEVEVDGVRIPAGELVLVSLVSANRDSERFTDPDRLDLTRAPGGNLAFGHGIHYCVGAPLARLEAQIAFRQLLDRYPDMELAAEPAELYWRASTLMRGLHSLPVRLGGGG
ncbi:cytochrome P450 family protein [Streptomyces lydicus]|uniref:cytochrome P450 n=1 Tax=Streptomyces lydicus TaxID=47763 RepID=UPI0037D865EC